MSIPASFIPSAPFSPSTMFIPQRSEGPIGPIGAIQSTESLTARINISTNTSTKLKVFSWNVAWLLKEYWRGINLISLCKSPDARFFTDLPPPSQRVTPVAQKIIETDADVVCLEEAFDPAALDMLTGADKSLVGLDKAIIDRLNTIYRSKISNIGDRGVPVLTVDSGLVVFSKYPILNIGYKRFENLKRIEAISGKGVVVVNILKDGLIVPVFITHTQYGIPLNGDLNAAPSASADEDRDEQFKLILDFMQQWYLKYKDNPFFVWPPILTGDLNTLLNDRANLWSLERHCEIFMPPKSPLMFTSQGPVSRLTRAARPSSFDLGQTDSSMLKAISRATTSAVRRVEDLVKRTLPQKDLTPTLIPTLTPTLMPSMPAGQVAIKVKHPQKHALLAFVLAPGATPKQVIGENFEDILEHCPRGETRCRNVVDKWFADRFGVNASSYFGYIRKSIRLEAKLETGTYTTDVARKICLIRKVIADYKAKYIENHCPEYLHKAREFEKKLLTTIFENIYYIYLSMPQDCCSTREYSNLFDLFRAVNPQTGRSFTRPFDLNNILSLYSSNPDRVLSIVLAFWEFYGIHAVRAIDINASRNIVRSTLVSAYSSVSSPDGRPMLASDHHGVLVEHVVSRPEM